MQDTINIDHLSAEQLAALQAQLSAKYVKANKEKEKAKVKYEKDRNQTISISVAKARKLSSLLADFKVQLAELMEQQHLALTEYGEIRSNSKGGFSITTTDGNLRVTRTRDTEPFWDERGTKAVAMLKEFLEETAKKRDQDLFEILMGFLSRNDKGDLEYAKVFSLLKHRNSFSDPRWIEGLSLLQESFQVHLRGFGYELKAKNEEGKWEPISLNFTSL